MHTRMYAHMHTLTLTHEREGGREREHMWHACVLVHTCMRTHMHSCNRPLFCNDLCEDVCRRSSNFAGR